MPPLSRLPQQVRPVRPEALRERVLLLVVLLLALLALTGPVVLQSANYHDFADQYAWGAMPHAMDVLSNLPFSLWGLAGAGALVHALHLRKLDKTAAGLGALFFFGLLVTTVVSAMYHWQPDNAGLVWDRTGMVLAFAGLLGLAVWQRIGDRAAWALAAIVLVLGPVSVQVWAVSGNLLPWAVLQFGGMALIAGLACLPSLPLETGRIHRGLSIRWPLVIALYALAKMLELGDHLVFEWTGHLVSGHSLKHIVASCAAWPVVAALKEAAKSRAESGSPPRVQQAATVHAA